MHAAGRALPLALLLLAVGTGCPPVGPDFERPRPQVGREMPEATTASTSSVAFTAGEPWRRWWEVFHDPDLETHVQAALDANQDLRAAYARVQISRSLVREAFAPLLPSIGTIGAYQYVKLPPLTGTGPNAPTTGPFSGQPFQAFAGLGSLTYEVDFWGKVRRSLEAANSDMTASDEDRKNVELTVIADVAQAYFDVGEGDAQVAIARDAVKTREETLAIVKKRLDTGFATELELRRTEAELASSRAQVRDYEATRATAEHRLAILTGRMPVLRFAGKPPAEFDVPPEIPLGLPAELLERRPDIRSAEAKLQGRNAGIGQAIAGFFPSLTIYGFAGYTALDISKIANPNSQLWAVGPVLRLPIFEGGRTAAQVLEAEARTDEALANYHAAVLKAFGEVADAIVRIAADRGMCDDQKAQVLASSRALDVARKQYDEGLALYLDVLDSQRTLLGARQGLVVTERRLLSDLVQLAKALGGGWSELPPDKFVDEVVEPAVPAGGE